MTIPIAFEAASQDLPDLPAYVRRKTRDAMVEKHILERMIHDLHYLLADEGEEAGEEESAVYLWDNIRDTVPNATSYRMGDTP